MKQTTGALCGYNQITTLTVRFEFYFSKSLSAQDFTIAQFIFR